MKKTLLLAALFIGAISNAQECTAVAELDENFNVFTFTGPGTGLPQNCWSKISTGPLVYIDGEEGENFVTFYASTSANVNAYLVSPELTTLGGGYELSFDTKRLLMGPPPAPGTVTIQLGTLSDNTDAGTFVAFGDPIAVTDATVTHANIAITAAEGQKYIAFRIVGDTPHNAASIDNIVWSEIPVVCNPVETIDEDFTSFTEDSFPQNCWLNIENGPMVYIDAEGEDRFATFYSFMSANVSGYVITPELTVSESNRVLTFDAVKQGAGVVTIQVGTITDAEDAETFTAVGDLITLTETEAQQSVELPAFANVQRVAFKITANTVHHAAFIDNIFITNLLSVNPVSQNASFAIYPNPSADKNVTVTLNNLTEKASISVYSITGAKVFETALTANTQELNLSALNSGMYIVRVEAGNYTDTQKLIIR